jgi:hypothetical protein
MWKEEVGAYFQETVYSFLSSSFLVRIKKIKKNQSKYLISWLQFKTYKVQRSSQTTDNRVTEEEFVEMLSK